ncbi:MAG TPA: signal peptidase I [Gaiellaceae bacterium]|nr:signal peptidase I [Gaiellaceae bacterium]
MGRLSLSGALVAVGVAALTAPLVAVASPPRLSKADFVRRANAICVQTAKRADNLPRPQTTAEALALLATEVRLYGQLGTEIRALRPPTALQANAAAMLKAFGRLRAALQQARADALAGKSTATDDDLRRASTDETQARTFAYRLGLTACSGGFEPGTRVLTVPSSAMEPTLECARPTPGCTGAADDRIRTRPLHKGEPRRFDILLFQTPPGTANVCGFGGLFVQRLIGLPGETVTEKRGLIFVDGKALREPFVPASRRGLQNGTWHVPKGRYFFMGDDRAVACDSRLFGSVARKGLVGKVVEILRGSKTIEVR